MACKMLQVFGSVTFQTSLFCDDGSALTLIYLVAGHLFKEQDRQKKRSSLGIGSEQMTAAIGSAIGALDTIYITGISP